jgi:hypothetical protein
MLKVNNKRLKLLLSVISVCIVITASAHSLKITGTDGYYQLLVDENPFFIKGDVALGDKGCCLRIWPEATYASYAGHGEKEPQPIPCLIKTNGPEIIFYTPPVEGAYRLFVYVYDGKSKFSRANLPQYVMK